MVPREGKDPDMTTGLAQYKTTETELRREGTAVEQATSQCFELQVTDQASYDLAAEATRYVKEQIKTLEDKRKSVTGPLLAVKREIDGWFKPVVEQWRLAEADLKDKMIDHARSVREANRKAQEEAVAADSPEEAVAALQTIAAKPQAKGTHTVKRWKYEVIDVGSVPVEYLAVDDREVKSAIKAGVREIDGLRIYQEEGLAVRT